MVSKGGDLPRTPGTEKDEVSGDLRWFQKQQSADGRVGPISKRSVRKAIRGGEPIPSPDQRGLAGEPEQVRPGNQRGKMVEGRDASPPDAGAGYDTGEGIGALPELDERSERPGPADPRTRSERDKFRPPERGERLLMPWEMDDHDDGPASTSSRELGEHSTGEDGTSSGNFVRSQLSAAVKGTFTAIIKRGLELVADAHGLGVLLRNAEWIWTAVEWRQVGEGRRGVDVGSSILLGSGVQVDLSAHAGLSPGGPLVTMCFAPVSGPDPGVLVVDGCQIAPGDALHKRAAEQPGERSAEEKGRVVFTNLELSRLMSREPDPRTRAAALMYLTKSKLVPALKRQRRWDDLEAAGVECVVCYDQKTKDSVWLFLSAVEARRSPARIAFDAAGSLMLWGY